MAIVACHREDAVVDADAGIYSIECTRCIYQNVPAGAFDMGCGADCTEHGNALPEHTVFLDNFLLRVTEVSQSQYQLCVSAGACSEPSANFDPAGAPGIPATNVTWNQAVAYCEWAGGWLPTEAQWEKGARSTDGRVYPWGNESADCSRARFVDCGVAAPAEVESSEHFGPSPYGMRNMAGNVGEWVADYYAEDYYATSPSEEPPGPTTGTQRVVRGGSFASSASEIQSFVRGPGVAGETVGFRCAAPSPIGGQ